MKKHTTDPSRIVDEAGQKRSGFTLIELLVVIAIIGTLASIVLVSVQGPRLQARDVKRLADLRSMQTAMELCYGDATCGSENAYIQYPNYTEASDLITGGIGSYIVSSAMPQDPRNVSPYVYTWEDNNLDNQTYCIWADLEGGNYVWVANYGSGESVAAGCP
ncbi:MAG: type II secretion system protein [Candidatus Spechtbacterales bacterium]